MPSSRMFSRKKSGLRVLMFATAALVLAAAFQFNLAAMFAANPQETAQPQQVPDEPPAAPQAAATTAKPVFDKPLAPDHLTFLNSFAGRKSADVIKDKQFRKLMDTVVPGTPIHVGRDRDLTDALDLGLASPGQPTQIRDGRYFMVSSTGSPQYPTRAFVWIDMQEGVALGGFYFGPTNGEPTPVLTIFSRQLKEKSLAMGDLPEAFADEVTTWDGPAHASPLATRYFINASGSKYVLEHDEDYCSSPDGSMPPDLNACEQMNADAADVDMNAAYFMKQTGHASNATAYMLDSEQLSWIQMRDTTCRTGPDPLGCHIRMTRERTGVMAGHPPRPTAPPRSHPSPAHK